MCDNLEVLQEIKLFIKLSYLVVIKIVENLWNLVLIVRLAFFLFLIIGLRDVELFCFGELEKDFLKILASRCNNCLVDSK